MAAAAASATAGAGACCCHCGNESALPRRTKRRTTTKKSGGCKNRWRANIKAVRLFHFRPKWHVTLGRIHMLQRIELISIASTAWIKIVGMSVFPAYFHGEILTRSRGVAPAAGTARGKHLTTKKEQLPAAGIEKYLRKPSKLKLVFFCSQGLPNIKLPFDDAVSLDNNLVSFRTSRIWIVFLPCRILLSCLVPVRLGRVLLYLNYQCIRQTSGDFML